MPPTPRLHLATDRHARGAGPPFSQSQWTAIPPTGCRSTPLASNRRTRGPSPASSARGRSPAPTGCASASVKSARRKKSVTAFWPSGPRPFWAWATGRTNSKGAIMGTWPTAGAGVVAVTGPQAVWWGVVAVVATVSLLLLVVLFRLDYRPRERLRALRVRFFRWAAGLPTAEQERSARLQQLEAIADVKVEQVAEVARAVMSSAAVATAYAGAITKIQPLLTDLARAAARREVQDEMSLFVERAFRVLSDEFPAVPVPVRLESPAGTSPGDPAGPPEAASERKEEVDVD